ncbi:thioredoxin-like isoform X4 [Acropora palmata]
MLEFEGSEECDEKYPEIVIVKVDVDVNEAVANKENIEVMPTFIFYKNGIKLGEFSGSSKEALMNKIQEFLNDK